jgi:TonB family protein
MLHTLLVAALFAGHPAAADSIRSDHDVRQVALRHAAEIQRCYESEGLRLNPTLRGTVEVELIVLPTGRVGNASVQRSQLAGLGKHEVEKCVLTAVRNWRFDRGPYATEAIVYPFSLVRDQRVRRTAALGPAAEPRG